MDNNELLIGGASEANKPVEQAVAKTEPAINNSLLRIQPAELTSAKANETERLTYKRAYDEEAQGVKSAPDIFGSDGAVIDARGKEDKGRAITRLYAEGEQVTGVGETPTPVDTLVTLGDNVEEMEYNARQQLGAVRRQREIMEKYNAFKEGRTSYEQFLLDAYGRDIMKASGYHTDSVAWWKSQFREGNYQHPLDNDYIRSGVVQQAESLFSLESFYGQLINPNTRDLESLVGQTLDATSYKQVFGESWTQIVDKLGDYETAVRYFRGGYLGDVLNTMIYKDYTNDGKGVGDPAYYVANDGKLYELVENTGQAIDKSRQMYLYKNTDGTVDRVSQAKSEFGEFWGAMANGFVGAATGVVDIFAMVGLDLWTAVASTDQLSAGDFFSKLLLPGVSALWVKDKDFMNAYTDYSNAMNETKTFALKVQDLDSDKWDKSSVTRAAGSAIGYVAETVVEIALGTLTAGAYTAAKGAGKAAQEAGEASIKAAVRAFKDQVLKNLSQVTGKATAKAVSETVEAGAKVVMTEANKQAVQEIGEKLLSNISPDIIMELAKSSGQEVIEDGGQKAARELLEKTVTEAAEAYAKENADEVLDLSSDAVKTSIVESVKKTIGQYTTNKTVITGIGGTLKEGTLWLADKGFKLSNNMKMLNSGSLAPFGQMFTKIISGMKFKGAAMMGKKWGPTIGRAIVNTYMTAAETAVNQRVRSRVDEGLTDEIIARNTMIAAGIAFASTLFLASSTNDKDNIERFAMDSDEITPFLARAKAQLGNNYTKDAVIARAKLLSDEFAQEVAEKFDTTDIGRYIKWQNIARGVGGVSELVDNILTTTTRNAANMGVKNVFGGDDSLFSMKNILSPDVLMPAMLSSSMSFFGRKGVAGFGQNEGSFTRGVAAARQDVRTMYMNFYNTVDILRQYASDDLEGQGFFTILSNMQKSFKERFAQEGDDAFAMLDVLDDMSKQLGAATGDPFASFDTLMKTFSETEAFKMAVKNKAFKDVKGFIKNGAYDPNFKMSDFVGLTISGQRIQNIFNYERAIMGEFEYRVASRKTAVEAAQKGHKFMANKIVTFFTDWAFNPIGKTAAADIHNTRDGIASGFLKNMGLPADGKVRSLTNTEIQTITAAMGEKISLAELLVEQSQPLIQMNALMMRNMKTYSIYDSVLNSLKIVKDAEQMLITQGLAKDQAEAAELVKNNFNTSKVKYESLTEAQKRAFDAVRIYVKDVGEKNEALMATVGLTPADIAELKKNCTDDKGVFNKQLFASHIMNGMVVNFADQDTMDKYAGMSPDSPEGLYRKAILAGMENVRKFSSEKGVSTFIVLGESKVFIASPVPIDSAPIVTQTVMKLNKIVLISGMLSNDKLAADDALNYSKALYSIIKPNDKTFTSVEDAVKNYITQQTDNAAPEFVAFINKMYTDKMINAKVVLNILAAAQAKGETFEIALLKQLGESKQVNPNSVCDVVFRVDKSLKEVQTLMAKFAEQTKANKESTPGALDVSNLATAVKILQENLFADNAKFKDLWDVYGKLSPGYIQSIQELYAKIMQDESNFHLTQAELEKHSKKLLISSPQNPTSRKDIVTSYRANKKLNNKLPFSERVENANKQLKTNRSIAEQITEKITALLTDPSALTDYRQNPKAFLNDLKDIATNGGDMEFASSIDGSKDFFDLEIFNVVKVREILAKSIIDAKGKTLTVDEIAHNQKLYDALDVLDQPNFRLALTIKELFSGIFDITDEQKQKLFNESLEIAITNAAPSDELKAYRLGLVLQEHGKELANLLLERTIGYENYSSITNIDSSFKRYIIDVMGDYSSSMLGNKAINDKIKELKANTTMTMDEKLETLNKVLSEEYEAVRIYTDVEEKIVQCFEARAKLYDAKFAINFPKNIQHVKVNIGELTTYAFGEFEKRSMALAQSKDADLSFDDINQVIRSIPQIDFAIKTLIALQKKYGSQPIIAFDLSKETDQEAFNKLCGLLYLDEDTVTTAFSGNTLKIPGMYFNGDNRAISGTKSQYKYKTIDDLILYEANNLRESITKDREFGDIANQQLFESIFPVGIINITGSTPLPRKGGKIPLNVGQAGVNRVLMTEVIEEVSDAMKQGKAASKTGNMKLARVLYSLGLDPANPKEFEAYLILRHIVEQSVDSPEAKNNGARNFTVPDMGDPAKQKEFADNLRLFGWNVSEDNKHISGLDPAKNAKFFADNDGNFSIFKYLPIHPSNEDPTKAKTFTMEEAEGSQESFERTFFRELHLLFNKKNADGKTKGLVGDDGILKITANATEEELVIPADVKTFQEAIDYFSKPEFKNSVSAKSLVFMLRSKIAASASYDAYLKTLFTAQETARLGSIAPFVKDKKFLHILSDSELTDKEKAARLNDHLKKNKAESEKINPFSNDSVDLFDQTKIKAKPGNLSIQESFTYDLTPDYRNAPTIELSDIQLLKSYAQQPFVADAPMTLSTFAVDLKNRFIALLDTDSQGNFVLPIANLSKITSEDLKQEIFDSNYGRKLTLGSWVGETFGKDFLHNLEQGITAYSKTYMSQGIVSSMLSPTEIRVRKANPFDPKQMNSGQGTLSKQEAIDIAEGRASNKQLARDRQEADNALINASVVNSKESGPLESLTKAVKGMVDDKDINPFDTSARNQITNFNNDIAAANALDNIFGLQGLLMKQGLNATDDPSKAIKFSNEEDAANLANQIYVLSNLNNNQMKTSFLIIEDSHEQTNRPKVITVFSNKEDPYSGLMNTMSKIKAKNGASYYLVSIAPGFTLRAPKDDDYSLKVMDITGFNKVGADPKNVVGRNAYLTMLAESSLKFKGISPDATVEEYNRHITAEAQRHYRISEDKQLLMETIREKFAGTDIDSNLLESFLNLFKTTLVEIQADSPSRGFKQETFFSTFTDDASILNEKARNITVRRQEGVLFNNLDIARPDQTLEDIIDSARRSIYLQTKGQSKEQKEIVEQAVSMLLRGEIDQLPRLMNQAAPATKEEDIQLIGQILMKFATRTTNTAFKKFVLQSIAHNQHFTLHNVIKLREKLSKTIMVTSTASGQKQDFTQIINDDSIVKFVSDSEWAFNDEDDITKQKRSMYEIGYVAQIGKGKIKRNFLIKVDDAIYNDVISELANDFNAGTQYKKFAQFLFKNNNIDAFKEAYANGHTKEEAFALFQKDFLDVANSNTGTKENNGFVVLSYNGKGKNSDFDVIKENFGEAGEQFVALLNNKDAFNQKSLGHIDLYEDVVKNIFDEQIDPLKSNNKHTLIAMAKKIMGTKNEAHTSIEDAELALDFAKKVIGFHHQKAYAETKVLDYVKEIFFHLTKRDISEAELNRIGLIMKFQTDKKMNDETYTRLQQWNESTKDMPEKVQNAILNGLEYIQRRIDFVRQRSAIDEDIRRESPYDFEEVKQFFEKLPDDAGGKVKFAINKIFGILNEKAKYSMDEDFVRDFVKAISVKFPHELDLMNTNNKIIRDSYTNNTFMDFINAVLKDTDGTINTIVASIASENHMFGNKTMTLSQDFKETNKDIYSAISSKDGQLLGGYVDDKNQHHGSYLENEAASKFLRKTANLLNTLLFEPFDNLTEKDANVINYIGNKILTLIGGTNIDNRNIGAEVNASARTKQLNGGEFFEALKKANAEGFKETLSQTGLYRYAHQITDETMARLKKSGLVDDENSVGIIVVNSIGAKQLLGTSLEEYKKTHNLKNVYVSLQRQPSDKDNPLHAYRLIEDTQDPETTTSKFSMNALELASKHSGDFDGDKISIFVPTDKMQAAYGDGTYLNFINSPYKAAQGFLKTVYEKTGTKFMFDEVYRDNQIQKEIAHVLSKNTKKVQQILLRLAEIRNAKDADAFDKLINDELLPLVKKQILSRDKDTSWTRKAIMLDKTNIDDVITLEKIKSNFISYDAIADIFFINNKYFLDKQGNTNSELLTGMKQDALEKLIKQIGFASAMTMRDSLTGVMEKDFQGYLPVFKKASYIAMKFTGTDFEVLQRFLKAASSKEEVVDMMVTSGITLAPDDNVADNKTLISNALVNFKSATDVYRIFLLSQAINRSSIAYQNVESHLASNLFDYENSLPPNMRSVDARTSLDKYLKTVSNQLAAFQEIMPANFHGNRFVGNSSTDPTIAALLMDVFNNGERYKRRTGSREIITIDEMKQRGLTKKVTALIDLDNVHGLADDNAKPVQKFLNDNFVYFSQVVDRFQDNVDDSRIPDNAKLVDSKNVFSRYQANVYKIPFNSDVKICGSETGGFSKVTYTGDPITGKEFDPYAYILPNAAVNKIKKVNSPNVIFGDGEITLNGHKYKKVSFDIAVNEYTGIWDQRTKAMTIDPLTVIHAYGTVESLPMMHGLTCKIDSKGEIQWDPEELRKIYRFQQDQKNQNFKSPDFMSTYNQLRGVIAIKYGLKNIDPEKDPSLFAQLQEADKYFSTPGYNYAGRQNTGYVFDIIRQVNIKTNGKFLQSIDEAKNDPQGIRRRLFSPLLFKLAAISTTAVYDSDVSAEIADLVQNNDGNIFTTKGGIQTATENLFTNEQLPISLDSEMIKTALQNKTGVELYLPALEAINFLLPRNEQLSIQDVKRMVASGLSNFGYISETSLANFFKPGNMSDVGQREADLEGTTRNQANDPKSGLAGDIPYLKGSVYTSYGSFEPKKMENDFFPGYSEDNNAFGKLMGLANTETKQGKTQIKTDGAIIKGRVTNQRFVNQLRSVVEKDYNTNDRIMQFHGSPVEKYVGFFNPIYSSLENGVLTYKYYRDQGEAKPTLQEFEKVMAMRNASSQGFSLNEAKNKIANENMANPIVNKEDIGEIKEKQKKILSPINLDLSKESDFRIKTMRDIYEQGKSLDSILDATKLPDDGVNPDDSIKKYFTPLTNGDVERTKVYYDPLDPEGIQVRNIKDMRIKQGIQNFFLGSKTYLAHATANLASIQSIIGTDGNKLNEFHVFTQARLLQLAYENTQANDDALNANKISDTMHELGFNTKESMDKFVQQYTALNSGIVSLYVKTVKDLQTFAKEIAKITGIENNPEELFLLSPLRKKITDRKENAPKYYSTLNTVFLSKKQNLEEIIIGATEYNFGDSVYYLASNFSKIKAMADAQKYFLQSGGMANKPIFDLANDDFGSRLRNLDDNADHLTINERIELVRTMARNNVSLNLNEDMANSKQFMAEVYDSITDTIAKMDVPDGYRNMSLYELTEARKTETETVTVQRIERLIELKKAQRDFMVDCLSLSKPLAKDLSAAILKKAETSGTVLTNEFMQMLPEDGKSHFNFLFGYDFGTIRRNLEYEMSGETKEQRIAYMALSGNLFLTSKSLAEHMDKYFFTEKIPTRVEEILGKARSGFTNAVMSMPHKLLNRLLQYSIGDVALVTSTDPTCVKNFPSSISELTAFFESKGATLDKNPQLKLFLDTIGFDPFSYHDKALNLDTFEYDSANFLGNGYYRKLVDSGFSAQTLMGRYALWSSLYKRFTDYEANPENDKRLYGPLYSMKDLVDQMESPEAKAREITYATIGGPNGFALIARKQLNNVGIFLTYPLALLRTGIGHLKSMGNVFGEWMKGTATNATQRYIGASGVSLIATQLLISMFAGLIADLYDVDEETEKEWKKKGTYIDPFLTLLNDRPIPLSGGSTGIYAQLREMFYEPYEEANGELLRGTGNWLSANILGRLNPLIKTPLELMFGKEFYGSAGPQDTEARNVFDHMARKVFSMFMGASGSAAMSDQWYYSKVGDEDPKFVNRLALSLEAAIKGELGNYRGYKIEQKNYFKALTILRGLKVMQNGEVGITNYTDNGFDLEDMSGLSTDLRKAMDKEQPPSVIYGIIDDYIKQGASASTIKAAIFNNSVSGKMSQITDFKNVYSKLSDKERTILEDAVKYEEANYSILKTMVAGYLEAQNGKTYSKKIYIPHNYYVYPSYDSNKFKNYHQYQNSWFGDKKWNQYAKDYMYYRSKKNFVPSLTAFTGKYAKDFYDYKEPKSKRVNGKVKASYLEDNSDYESHKVNKKGR